MPKVSKKQGLLMLDSIIDNLKGGYSTLEELYAQVNHPVSAQVQAKAEEVINASISVACMALNFKELPQEAKKPLAALLYAAADSLSGEGFKQ